MTSSAEATSSMFLSNALQKILSEKETKQKQHAKLRAACESALEEINKEIQHHHQQHAAGPAASNGSVVGPDTPLPPPREQDRFVNADKYFTPFKLACESRSPRIMRTALDCLQKLMAYGHLTGGLLAEVDGMPDATRLIDLIVDTVRNCFVGEQTDEGVQLQIIKALLTAVTTASCDVHEGTLLRAVRTCYSIYLASRNIVNQTTAKATLTQMLSVIFQRMESVGMGPTLGNAAAPAPGSDAASMAPSVRAEDVFGGEGDGTTDEAQSESGAHSEAGASSGVAGDHGRDDAEGEGEGEGEVMSADRVAHEVLEDILDKIVGSGDGRAAAPADQPADPLPACVVCKKPTDHVCASTRQPVCQGECMEVHARRSAPESRDGGDEEGSGKDERYGHVFRKDAYLVFRSICKLSLKELPDREPVDRTSHDLRSKLLSLDLQLMILEGAGPVFLNDPLFVEPVKMYLCASLMKNGASHVVEVFDRSLQIFQILLDRFKVHLKSQIELFFRDILLNVLEISTSSFQHKWLVMQALSKICVRKQTLMDLYVNYDCEEYSTNIFERMINDLSRVTQGRHASELGATPVQEMSMKVKGLECLVSAMRCFDEWCRPLEQQLNEELIPKQEAEEGSVPNSLNALSPHLSSSSFPAGGEQLSETAEFESRKQKKDLREKCIELFNKSPAKGVRALKECGFVGSDVRSVAQFLHMEPRLDRTAIGDYLGEKDDFCVEVMHAYIDLVDFKSVISKSSNMAFLDALRLFLGCFKIPGESQKIDRMMLKFAQRFCEVCPENGVFASADAAYVLAYSVMMLNTDLHNTQVKRKITKEGFVRMTRGINDNRDLPKTFVEDIFDAIAKDEIILHTAESSNHDAKKPFVTGTTSAGGAAGAAAHEDAASRMTYTHATDVQHVRPLFKLVWKPLLAAFTVSLNSHQEPSVVALCLEGLSTSIHIACLFTMTFERDAFVKSLAHFTNLSSAEELKHKHIEAVRTLLACAVREGNYLGEIWRDVIHCVSQLDNAQLLGTPSSQPAARRRQETLSEASSMNIVLAVDKIFSTTRRLNGEAIVDFVKALCSVSQEELQQNPPRMYSLAKLVDIAYYNMERVRIEWSHVWAVMGEHFNRVGCMSNADVACFAVDSLRQLSMKFLEKGELANYSFQKDFLRPFEYIINHNKAASIRDMVVRCVAQMVQAKAANIRSGWKNIFFVFSMAASDSDQSIVDLAFSTTTHIFDTCFSKQHDSRVIVISSSFMDAVNCMAEFACNAYFPDISMEAIRQLRSCATHVADSPELFVSPEEAHGDEPKIWVKGWFPVLFGLSRIINRCKLDVRTRALTVMFEVMKTYGSHYLPQWWVDLFRVVFRIFDDKKLQTMHSDQERAAWLSTTCAHALRSVVDVLTQYFSTLQPVLMGEMFALLEWCICDADNEQLGRAGTECLHIMVMSNGSTFTDASWEMFCASITRMFRRSLPQEVFIVGEELKESHSHSAPHSAAPAPATPSNEAAHTGNGDTHAHTPAQPLASTSAGAAPPPSTPSAPAPAVVSTPTKAHAPRVSLQQRSNSAIMKCVTQLELIQTLEWILLSSTRPETAESRAPKTPAPPKSDQNATRQYARKMALAKPVDRAGDLFAALSSPRLLALLDCLTESHKFAQTFNRNEELRERLCEAGFMKKGTKPNLYRLEIASISAALRVMFRICEAPSLEGVWATVEERLQQACGGVLRQYVWEVTREMREAWTPMVTLLLREILALNDERFCKYASAHFPAFGELLTLAFEAPLGDAAFLLSELVVRSRGFKL